MIVPRTPLIVLTAVLLVPITLGAALYPQLLPAACIAAGGWLGIALVDARSRRAALNAVRISIPGVLRMTVERETHIPVNVRRAPGSALPLRLGVALPTALVSRSADLWCNLQAHQERAVGEWICRPLRRGRFRLTRCHAEVPSRWKLWGLRKRFELDSEIRIYPDLVGGQKQLAGIFRPGQWGLRTRRRIGKGREFEQLRDYLPGDSYEDVDWKATARRRMPITRVYQVEEAQEVYVVLDASRLSTRNAAFLTDRRRRSREGEGEKVSRSTIFECFITAALVMALAVERAADRYGLLVFSDAPNCLIKAGRGRAHYNACRDALYNRMPDAVAPDFNELFTFIGAHLRKRSLLVMLTSLDDPVLSESFLHAATGMARRHMMMVNMLRPQGAQPLFSVSDVRETAGIYQHLAGHLIWSTLEETGRQLKRQGVGFQLLDHISLTSQVVNQYMEVKQRQLL